MEKVEAFKIGDRVVIDPIPGLDPAYGFIVGNAYLPYYDALPAHLAVRLEEGLYNPQRNFWIRDIVCHVGNLRKAEENSKILLDSPK